MNERKNESGRRPGIGWAGKDTQPRGATGAGWALGLLLAAGLAACGHAPTQEPAEARRAGAREAELGPLAPPVAPLPWEAGHPERAGWSALAFTLIRRRYLPDLDRAADVTRFCPNYTDLSPDQRATAWAAVVAGVAYFESGWRPTARSPQPGGGADPVTGQPVVAEGLLQLGYGDALRGGYCRFDGIADANLTPSDPAKTILDPAKNLECGIGILARQVARRGRLVSASGIYWAVLHEGGRFERSREIAAMSGRLPFCGN